MSLNRYDANDFKARHALDEISALVSKEVSFKGKSLIKFGRNDSVGSAGYSTVWETGGNETYLSDNLITTVSSSSASDTGSVAIEGHTVDGNGDFTFVPQTATLDGQNQVTLATPIARSTRLANAGADDFVGTVYVYEDDTDTDGVPDTAAKIHLSAKPGDNRSLKCATTISNDDYWIITGLAVSVNSKRDAFADFALQIRDKGGVFQTVYQIGATNNSGPPTTLDVPIIVMPNSDVRVVAVADGNGTSVNATISGFLAQ